MNDIKRRGRPRGPQAIFSLMISMGQYGEYYVAGLSSGFMCNAIGEVYRKGVITEREHDNALEAINAYLEESPGYYDGITLISVLQGAGQPCDFAARAALYANWAKRPSLTGEYHAQAIE